MKPTVSELASLAAILSNGKGTDPKSALPDALDLWRAAHAFLNPESRPSGLEERLDLDKVLEGILPTLRRGQRRKQFHDFILAGQWGKVFLASAKPGEEDARRERGFQGFWETLLEKGVRPSDARQWAEEMPRWHSERVSVAKRVGAKIKHERSMAKLRATAEARRAALAWGNAGRPVMLRLTEADRLPTGKTPVRGARVA